MKTFWLLWNPEGKTPPTVRFSSLQAAKTEAARLQSHIGFGTMYVMRAVDACTVKPVIEWEKKEKSK